MKLSHMAGVPIQVTLAGKEYTLSPIQLEDLAFLEKWLETRPVARLMEMLGSHGKDLPQETKDKLLADEIARSARVCILEGNSWESIRSIEGTQMFLWLSLRRKHPEVTREQVLTMISALNLAEIQMKLDEASGLLDKEEGASGKSKGRTRDQLSGLGSTERSQSVTGSPPKK